jgi:putative ABC transport system permease protein
VLVGAIATVVYAGSKTWAIVIPIEAWTGGIASAILIGALPACRPPSERPECHPPWRCEP